MLFDDTYITVAGTGRSDFRIKSSRFLGFAYPLHSESEVKTILNGLKKEHPQANHHCYAYRLTTDPTVFRSSDDREPSGSAGKPILGAINSSGITYALAVVVRYFGGTQLGIPGLIQAYKQAATEAIAAAGRKEGFLSDKYRIEFPYNLLNELYRVIRLSGAKITGQQLDSSSSIDVEIRKSLTQGFLSALQTHPSLAHLCKIEPIYHGTS